MKSCNSCPAGQVPYTVRSGDTIWGIARSYGTTTEEILSANPNINPATLQVGQQLCLPFTGERYPMCRTGNYYVVREGQGLNSIAQYFGVTEDMLVQNNMGIDPTALFEGQILCIPVAPSPVRIEIGGGKLRVVHKSGGETSCPVEGSFSGETCVINKQLDIGISGARILNLSNSMSISGKSSGYGGIVIANEDMDALFNLTPVGAKVIGQQ